MTGLRELVRLQTAARRRAVFDTLAIGLPLVLAVAALTSRGLGGWTAVAIGGVGLAATGLAAARRARRFDRAWLVATLDARVPALEDSTALLFVAPETLTGLARLQQDRLRSRLTDLGALDLRQDWSRRSVFVAVALAAAAILTAMVWPARSESEGPQRDATQPRAAAGAPRISDTRLRIIPPAYTGLAATDQTGLDARLPEGSRIEWSLGLTPPGAAVALAFPGELPLALGQAGGRWSGARAFNRSALYRIDAPNLPRQRLHRLEVIPDAAPVIKLVAPASALILATPGQARWTPVFEASDDYGVEATASLRVILTKGEGENVKSTEHMLRLQGQGEARRRRFSTTLDLVGEGMAPGSDLIVQLIVRDNRTPGPQTVEGPSVILRWPAGLGLADGLDGMARQVMPAYFRSQRQIIIDAEALIAQRRRITADQFLDRSNGLGADQAQLRLRYGQFMGEEAEGGGGGLALPTNDAPPLPTNDAPAPAAKATEPDHAGHDHEGHDADHAAEGDTFGQMTDVVAQFGHAHDSGDAATLFDPGTRSTLSLALDAMWSSERALRQGKPQDALPHAHRALELLKTAQQATRIFLARTAPKLPPIDLSRRLSGKRDGIVAGGLAPLDRAPKVPVLADAWRALGDSPGASPAPLRLDALERWVQANGASLSDPLALSAAIDTVRNEPQCLDCRRRLQALLWTALERPAASVKRRTPPSVRGRRYLEALQ